jgi:dienelactone hydrolase
MRPSNVQHLAQFAAVNARDVSLEDHLQDIPVCAREVAIHGICSGASAALAAAQLCSGTSFIT